MPDTPMINVYTLTIGARGTDDEVHTFTTQAARLAALNDFVATHWDEYFEDPIPEDMGEASERLHQETDISWQMDDGPLQGPPLPAIVTLARLRTMLMGAVEGDETNCLEAVQTVLFKLPGFVEVQEIWSEEHTIANWDDISEAWDTLLTPDGPLPTPAEITTWLMQAPESAHATWIMQYRQFAGEQGWAVTSSSPHGLRIQRLEDANVFTDDKAAVLYVERQAARGQQAAIDAIELCRRPDKKGSR